MSVAKRIRRNITLIEVMIVMAIIALITGVLGYNYHASLEESRAGTTKLGIARLNNILLLETSTLPSLDNVEANWKELVKKSALANDASVTKDGWGQEYQVRVVDGEIIITSERFENYKKSHPGSFKGQ